MSAFRLQGKAMRMYFPTIHIDPLFKASQVVWNCFWCVSWLIYINNELCFLKLLVLLGLLSMSPKSINQATAEENALRFMTCKLELVLVTLLNLTKWLYCSCESGHLWWLSNLQMCHAGQGAWIEKVLKHKEFGKCSSVDSPRGWQWDGVTPLLCSLDF